MSKGVNPHCSLAHCSLLVTRGLTAPKDTDTRSILYPISHEPLERNCNPGDCRVCYIVIGCRVSSVKG